MADDWLVTPLCLRGVVRSPGGLLARVWAWALADFVFWRSVVVNMGVTVECDG